ncbi:MAG: tetratricopeptide repeat protein [Cyclobacteriaceae bacterium]
MESNRSEKDVRVDRYVQNRMLPEDREAFETEMNNDTELRNEVHFRQAIQDGIRQGKNHELKSRLDAIHSEVVEDSIKTQPERKQDDGRILSLTSRWWLGAAASVILVMTLALWASGVFSRPDESLFAQHYKRPAYSIDRGSADEALAEAGQYYNQGQFEEAAYRFEDYLLAHDDDAYVRFMAAISYLESGDTDDAKSHLRTLIKDDGPLGHRAKWYLSLTYLWEGNEQEATFWLKRLVGDTRAKPYNKQASALLKKLD